MVGRAALGQPWLPGQIARHLDGAADEGDPSLQQQFANCERAVSRSLSLIMAIEIGRRHARKHLAAAIDVAGEYAGAGADMIKSLRGPVLTAETPADTLSLLTTAYAVFETLATGTPGLRAAA